MVAVLTGSKPAGMSRDVKNFLYFSFELLPALFCTTCTTSVFV